MSEKIIIPNLGNLSGTVLKDELDEAGITYETESQDHGGHGELATMSIILVGTAAVAVTAIAGWLLKTRYGKKVRFTYRRKLADGTEDELTFEYDIRNEEAPEPELIAQLKNAFAFGLKV